tara:strand:- start:19014 stop:22856 length:3843 start_codon:yes stop_codon:yes gene_type:complete
LIFEVTPDEIAELGDAELRSLVGRLAEQVAVECGCSPAGITYGGHQNAADGGIDVRAAISNAADTNFIPRNNTGFQVKAENLARQAVIDEMRPGGELRQSIANLAAQGGAYIIVSSQGSVSDTALTNRRKAMYEAVQDLPGKDQLHLDYFDRQRLATWVNQTPGLVAWVKEHVGKPLSGWQPFGDWSSSPGVVEDEYLGDENVRLKGPGLGDTGSLNVEDGVNRLRDILRQPRGAIRLVGLSGVGKTRLVQALFDGRVGENAISPHTAIYTDLADEPEPVPAELLVNLQGRRKPCVFIIDNCGIALHRKLVARLQKSGAPVSLITVEYDIADETPENTDVFKLEPASNEIIDEILQKRYPNLTNPEIGTITAFSEGNFRIALALAETARNGESLANLNDGELFTRLFRQNKEHDPALYRAAQACSLVYSFDVETLGGDDAELPILAGLAEQSVSEFYAHVSELTRRQLVQQRSKWRALLPHAIAHRLAKQALQDLPKSIILAALASNSVPDRLLRSFSRRLGCLHDCREAQNIVGEWLGEGGILASAGSLDDLGRTVLDNVAPVDPAATLACLERAAKSDENFFDGDQHEQQRLIRLLRSLAYEPDFFAPAARLISGFSKNGAASNNTGDGVSVFSSLFTLYLSGTKASPSERAELILEFAQTGDERNAKLALAALESMLQTDHFISSYGFEFGTRKRDYGLSPASPDEFRDWFGSAFNACSFMAKLPHLREQTRDLIGQRFAWLVFKTGMTPELIALADELYSDGGWPQGWVAARGAIRQLKETERAEEIAQLRVLEGRLAPQTLEDRIGAYILPKGWSALDVVEIELNDDERYSKAEDEATRIAADIGKELAADLDLFARHMPALATAESYRIVSVLRAVGENVRDIAAAWAIVSAASIETLGKASYSLAGVFIGAAAEQNRPLVENLLDTALADEKLHPLFVNLQSNVGLDDRGIERLITAAKMPSIPISTFHHLSSGRALECFDPDSFCQLMKSIAQRSEGEPVAFEIMRHLIYRRNSDKIPLKQAEKEAGKHLLENAMFSREDHQNGHRYKKVAQACLEEGKDAQVARKICQTLVKGLVDYSIYAHDFGGLVGVLADKFPQEVLDELIGRASKSGEIEELFETRRIAKLNPASRLSAAAIFKWVREAPEDRCLAIAHVMPIWERPEKEQENRPPLEDYAGPVSWTEPALRLLNECPDPKTVLEIMVERFRPNGWSGSLAAILESRLPLLKELCASPNTEIANAAQAMIGDFSDYIEKQKDWEAKNDRQRDERFEW